MAAMANLGLSPNLILQLGYGISPKEIEDPDLIVSAGAETLAANIAVSRLTGAPNLFHGSLRNFKSDDFSLVLTSYAEHSNLPRHRIILKPSPFVLSPRKETKRASPRHSKRGALLIGGDSGECKFAAQDWTALLDFIETSSNAFGVRWNISNSRRTPAWLSDKLAARQTGEPATFDHYIDVRTAGPGTLVRVLENADFVICTDDSSSMISEAASVRLPVVGVAPRHQYLTQKEQGYRDFLARSGYYRSINIADLEFGQLMNVIDTLRPMAGDPVDSLATILCYELPDLFQARRRRRNGDAFSRHLSS